MFAVQLTVTIKQTARRYRENKAEIDNLRWQLSVVRKRVAR